MGQVLSKTLDIGIPRMNADLKKKGRRREREEDRQRWTQVWQMTQWAKCLPEKCEDWSLDPRTYADVA